MQRIRRVTNEPMFISETGANDVAGKVKALDSLGSGMAHYHMAGYIWFDIDQPGLRLHEPQNFAISNNQAALDVYKASLLPYERPASTRTS